VNTTNQRPLRNVNFVVHHTDPGFLISVEHPSTVPAAEAQQFRTLMTGYVDQHILPNLATLRSYNDNPRYRGVRLSCQTVAVRSLPNLCAYIIGDQVLYLGKFLWDGATGDFGLTRTSCFRIERGRGPADVLIDWCLNVADQQWGWNR
jgi:hypothetical protein